ncbi:MAG: DinB family protein [Flavobacteriales bacterium]
MLNIATLIFIGYLQTATISSSPDKEASSHFEMNNDLNQLKKYAAYNTWANQQLVQWLSTADSAQWHKEINSSFNTLDLTLRHLWNAEHGWLCALKDIPWESAIDRGEVMPKEQMLREFAQTTNKFQHFVESMTDAQFKEMRKLGKEDKSVTLADIVLHVFNHATYHRGQLITMGRQVGLSSPPRTDFIHYISQ